MTGAEYQRQWYRRHLTRNRELGRIRSAKWRKDNPEASRKVIQRYVVSNRDRINARNRERYSDDGRWEKQLWKRYRLKLVSYWKMFDEQKGLCLICHCPQIAAVGRKLDVDHDHLSKKVRGLLCRHCNAALGLFKEDILRFKNAVRYLTKFLDENCHK